MIRLQVLGGVEVAVVTDAQGTIVPLQPKRVALLAYLALAGRHARFHRRDHIVDVFWPQLGQERARAALRKTLHFLRASIGSHFLTSRGDEEIGLLHERVQCDALIFGQRLRAGDLAGAMALYHGDLLPGFHLADSPRFDQWADGERTRLRAAACGACIQLAEQAEAQGRFTKAVHWARHAEALFPQKEEVGRLLMLMLAASGDRSGALLKYAEIEEYLLREFGVEPSAETKLVAEDVRSASLPSRRMTPAHSTPSVELDEFYRQLVETMADVIYCCDSDGRFTYANAAASRLLGVPVRDVLGRLYLEFVREDYREEVLNFYLRQMHDRIPLTYLEYPAVRPDGAPVWLGQNVQLVQDQGKVVGIQAVARDITARRRADKVTARTLDTARAQAG